MLTFYGYKNCSSCRSAEKALTASGVNYSFIDITLEPPTARQLKSWLKESELNPKKCLNTNGEVYRTMGLKEKLSGMSDDSIIAALAANGRLIKRPLITDQKSLTVGFKDETIAQWAKKA